MSLRVAWTVFALERVEVLTEFVARRNPARAVQLIGELFDRVALLGNQPALGHVLHLLEEPSIRQMYFGQYRVLYLVDQPADAVFVLAVQHGKEQPHEREELEEILDLAENTRST